MKLWKVRIKTYCFGLHYYEIFVLANTKSEMLKTVALHPSLKKDENAVIDDCEEIDLTDETNRVL